MHLKRSQLTQFKLSDQYMRPNVAEKPSNCCAISGLALGTSRGNNRDKNPFAGSIDRIDSNVGYEQGNVRLLTHWVNNALNTYPDEIFNYFVEQTMKHKQQTVYMG